MEGFWGYWVLGWEARPPPCTSASLYQCIPGPVHPWGARPRAIPMLVSITSSAKAERWL